MKYGLIILFIVFNQCSTNSGKENQNPGKLNHTPERNPVDVIVLKKTDFRKEMVSNGRLCALQKSALKFRISEELEYLPVKNGDRVKKGRLIARLHRFDQEQELERANIQMKKAEVDFSDELILMGYGQNNNRQPPDNLLNIAKIRSGLMSAENNLVTAMFNYKSTSLKAPFSGTVANLNYKVHDMVSSGEEFCTLIDDSVFEVEFSVLETELSEISLDKEVKIIPFANEIIVKGVVCEINPVVEENGMVKVKAMVNNAGMLMEGMNVEVLVETRVPDRLVVPKTAMVLRQNQEVLFVYKNGKAFWTYVQTEFESSSSYTVQAHPGKGGTLEAGDTVIISGNLNLAHESDVIIK